jgi:predicted PurR-regulated permease PerM
MRIAVSGKTMWMAAGICGAIWLLVRLWPILLVILSSLILVGTLTPVVDAAVRRGLRRSWAVAFVFGSLGLIAAAAVLLLIPPLWRQLLNFAEAAPSLQARLAALLGHARLTRSLAEGIAHLRLASLMSFETTKALDYSRAVAEVVGYTMTSVVLALYIVADRDRARGALFALVPRCHHLRLASILLKLETIVGGYVRGQLITSFAIFGFVLLLLGLCRVPGAVALATCASLTDLIPFVGGLLATTPVVAAALSKGVGTAVLVLSAMVIYQEFESRVLMPRIYGRTLRLPSAAVVVALLIGGKLLGIVGALLALPVAAGLLMLLKELRVELPGEAHNDSALREFDDRAERIYAALTVGEPAEAAAAVAVEMADQLDPSSEVERSK